MKFNAILVSALGAVVMWCGVAVADPLLARPEYQCSIVGGGVNPSLRIRVTSYTEARDWSNTPVYTLAIVEVNQVAGKPIHVVINDECEAPGPAGSACTTTVSGEGFLLQGSRNTALPTRTFNATYQGDSMSAEVVCTF